MKGLDAPLLYLLSLSPPSSLLRSPGGVLCRMPGLVTTPAPGSRHGGSQSSSLASGVITDLSLVNVKMTVCIFGSDRCLHPSSLFTPKNNKISRTHVNICSQHPSCGAGWMWILLMYQSSLISEVFFARLTDNVCLLYSWLLLLSNYFTAIFSTTTAP